MKEQIEVNFRSLELINRWIENADTKASIILGFSGVFLGFFIKWMEKFLNLELINYCLIKFILISTIGVTCLILLCLGIYSLFQVLFPNVKEHCPSIFYFSSISNLKLEEFINKIKSIKDDEIEDDLINQIYINAKIANAKFTNLSTGIKRIMFGFFLGIAFFILII